MATRTQDLRHAPSRRVLVHIAGLQPGGRRVQDDHRLTVARLGEQRFQVGANGNIDLDHFRQLSLLGEQLWPVAVRRTRATGSVV